MDITEVDERDSAWESGSPRFRVYFRDVVTEQDSSGAVSTFDIVGADIIETLAWAEKNVGEHREFAVALVVDDGLRELESPGTGRGLVWLTPPTGE